MTKVIAAGEPIAHPRTYLSSPLVLQQGNFALLFVVALGAPSTIKSAKAQLQTYQNFCDEPLASATNGAAMRVDGGVVRAIV